MWLNSAFPIQADLGLLIFYLDKDVLNFENNTDGQFYYVSMYFIEILLYFDKCRQCNLECFISFQLQVDCYPLLVMWGLVDHKPVKHPMFEVDIVNFCVYLKYCAVPMRQLAEGTFQFHYTCSCLFSCSCLPRNMYMFRMLFVVACLPVLFECFWW